MGRAASGDPEWGVSPTSAAHPSHGATLDSQDPHCSVGVRGDPGRKHRGASSRAEGGTWAERDTLGHLRVEEVDWLHQLLAFAAEPQVPPPDPNPRGPPSRMQPFLYPPPHLLPISSMQV